MYGLAAAIIRTSDAITTTPHARFFNLYTENGQRMCTCSNGPGFRMVPDGQVFANCFGANISPKLSKKAYAAPGSKFKMTVVVRNLEASTNYPGVGLAITVPQGISVVSAAPARARLPAAAPFGSSKKTATTVSVVNARVNGSVVAWPGLMLLARAYRVYSMVALVSKTAPRQVHLTFQTATF